MPADLRRIRLVAARRRRIAAFLCSEGPKLLHVGAGSNSLEGWLNSDVEPTSSDVIYLDISERMPFPDVSIDRIFGEHLIEHVPLAKGIAFLGEAFRIIVPGGRVRIATPDLQALARLCGDGLSDREKAIVADYVKRFLRDTGRVSGSFVVNNEFRAWGHQFLYDRATLCEALESIGFRELRWCRPGDSPDPLLQDVDHHGAAIGSQEMNDFFTMTVEAVRPRS